MKKILILLITMGILYGQVSKPVIGIGEITWGRGTTETFRSEIEIGLAETNKFELIERQRMADILKEQSLSVTGLVEGAGKIGGLGGIDYILYGSVNSVDTESVESLFFEGEYNYYAEVSMSIKVVDINSGRIALTLSVKERSGGEDNEDLAVDDVRRRAAKKIAKELALKVFPIKVVNVAGNKVYINYGETVIKDKGGYKIVQLGGGFVDPDTGEILGAEETYIGMIQIESRAEKYSIGKIIHKAGTVNVGDELKPLSSKKFRSLKKKYKVK